MPESSPRVNPAIFRAYDIRGIVGEDVTPAIAEVIGRATGTLIRRRWGNRIVVGMDNRMSSEELKGALIAGLRSTGCDVTDIGLSTSPMQYYAVIEGRFSGGVEVTASHNPKEYNGFKVVGAEAFPVAGEDIYRLRDLALAGDFETGAGSLASWDPAPGYLEKIRGNVQLRRSVKVVVDTGNGVAGKFAPELLRSVGCEVVELHTELDGRFPNHLPNPEREENVLCVERKVLETGAELGVAFDGDGDRLGVVDEKGQYREADYLIIVLARDYLTRHPGETVLIDVKSSQNVIDDIRSHGGVPLLYKTGHSLIKQKMRADSIMLGGELSGHLYLFENYYPYDDAFMAAARVLEVLSRSQVPFSEQFAGLPGLYSTRLIELPCADTAKFEVVGRLVKELAASHEVNDIDGARVTYPGGWAIVRASNTTPMLTVRAEANSPERLAAIVRDVHRALDGYPEVQAGPLLAAGHQVPDNK